MKNNSKIKRIISEELTYAKLRDELTNLDYQILFSKAAVLFYESELKNLFSVYHVIEQFSNYKESEAGQVAWDMLNSDAGKIKDMKKLVSGFIKYFNAEIDVENNYQMDCLNSYIKSIKGIEKDKTREIIAIKQALIEAYSDENSLSNQIANFFNGNSNRFKEDIKNYIGILEEIEKFKNNESTIVDVCKKINEFTIEKVIDFNQKLHQKVHDRQVIIILSSIIWPNDEMKAFKIYSMYLKNFF